MKTRTGLLCGILLFVSFLLNAQENFQISYSASGDESIEWIIPSNDGNLILAGNTNSVDPSGDGLVMKTDMSGNIIWSKRLGGQGWDEIVRIIACTDGGYAIVGYTSSWGQGDRDAWITRIAENGDVMWSSCFGSYYWDSARGIIQTADGGFIVIGQENNFDYAFFMKLDSQGELLWKQEYFFDIVTWFNEIIENGNGGYFLTGAVNYDGFGIHDTFIMETDSVGNILLCKVYGEYENDSFRKLIPYQDGFLAVGDSWSWENHQLGWMALLNSELEIEKSVVLGDVNVNQYFESACIISNSIYGDIKLANGTAYIIRLDSALNFIQSWQFNPGQTSYSSHLLGTGDNGLIFAGSTTDKQTMHKDVYLTEFNPKDTSYACNMVAHSTFIEQVSVLSGNLGIYPAPNNTVYGQIIFESIDFSMDTKVLCLEPPVADFSSPENTCANAPFLVTDNSLYAETYYWTFEGGTPASSEAPDPGIIVYDTPGIYSIKLVVSNEAGLDSLTRELAVWPIPEVYLGADTTLAAGEPLILDAGPDMDHYLWQDGSTGQTIEVTENGMYWAIVEKDLCFASDTINITPDALASINENEPDGILLYPNPARKSSQISIKSGETPESVVFYNYAGEKVKSVHPLNNTININDLIPGVYIVEMVYQDNIVKRRLIIL